MEESIGNVQAIYLKSIDSMTNEYSTNVSKGFTVNSAATYQQIDTAMRALNGLTTNTYDDTILIAEISVNDKIAEGAAGGE